MKHILPCLNSFLWKIRRFSIFFHITLNQCILITCANIKIWILNFRYRGLNYSYLLEILAMHCKTFYIIYITLIGMRLENLKHLTLSIFKNRTLGLCFLLFWFSLSICLIKVFHNVRKMSKIIPILID